MPKKTTELWVRRAGVCSVLTWGCFHFPHPQLQHEGCTGVGRPQGLAAEAAGDLVILQQCVMPGPAALSVEVRTSATGGESILLAEAVHVYRRNEKGPRRK